MNLQDFKITVRQKNERNICYGWLQSARYLLSLSQGLGMMMLMMTKMMVVMIICGNIVPPAWNLYLNCLLIDPC